MSFGEVTKCRKLQRILESLHDCWLDDPETEYAEISIHTRKSNGEEDGEVIIWRKPSKYEEEAYGMMEEKDEKERD